MATGQTCDLTKKKCVPCEGGVPALSTDEAQTLVGQLKGWKLAGKQIEKEYTFKDFVQAMAFTNGVAEQAESEGHHPDIHIHYNKVQLVLWTHAVDGLTENDFILAAKIDAGKQSAGKESAGKESERTSK